jgi:hypothetical protein
MVGSLYRSYHQAYPGARREQCMQILTAALFRNLTLPDGNPSFATRPAFEAEPCHIFASCVRRNGEQILRHAQVLGKF